MFVSIVIPTCRREYALQRTLVSLGKQLASAHGYEILVVSNGTLDTSTDVVRTVCDWFPRLNVRHVHEEVPGLVAGRHRGIKETDGEILTFIDDDFEVSSTWMNSIHGAFGDSSVTLVGGRHAQAMLLLSDYEGLPLTVLEAMACGLVPICLRIRSGLPELIEQGRNGYLVDGRGPGVVAAVRELAADSARWERMSAAARETVAIKFSVDSCVSRWLKLLGRLAPAGPSAGCIRVPWIVRLPERDPAWGEWDVPRRRSVIRRLFSAARRLVHRFKAAPRVPPAE
jgi:hypothetical protein